MTRRMTRLLPLCVPLLVAACGGKESTSHPATGGAGAAGGGELTPFQIEHGIGPITEVVQLGPIDEKMAEAGEETFKTKCSPCHKMSERYVGPPLAEVTKRRSPAFIMNQILNPEGMYTKHPVVRQLLGEYMTQMPNLALTKEQARQVLEYLRTQAPDHSGS